MDEHNAIITMDTDNKSAINHPHDVIANLLASLQTIEQLQSMHDVDRVRSIIDQLNFHLPGPITPEKLRRYDVSGDTDWKQIAENEYAAIECKLIRLFDNDWPISNQHEIESNVCKLFAIDHSADFVKTTLFIIFDKQNAAKFDKLVKIFDMCITNETWLLSAFIDFCSVTNGVGAEHRDEFIQLLVAAPSKIANHFMGKQSNRFTDECYSCTLLLALIQAIYFIAETNRIEQQTLFSCKFLGQLLGRIAVDFNLNRTSSILPKTFEILSILTAKSLQLKRCVNEMILEIPRQSYDIVAWYVLNTSNPIGILGDAINVSLDWQFILRTKYPLSIPKAATDKFIRNLIRLLAECLADEDRCAILIDLAKAWSSKLSIKTNSVDQHMNLTKLLIIGVEQFGLRNNVESAEQFNLVVHNGVRNHMDVLDEKMRAIGMITAEIILNKLNMHGISDDGEDSLLRFEYDGFGKETLIYVDKLRQLNESIEISEELVGDNELDDHISFLYNIRECQSGATTQIIPATVKNTIEFGSLPVEPLKSSLVLVKSKPNVADEDDLDSDDDDDLQPYDMSNDTPLAQDKRPKYLRDLRNALTETDDAEVFEQSITACAGLVEAKLAGDQSEIGVELLRVLIELDQRFYMEDFEFHRVSACVAICCTVPKECAEFLCKQIHAEMGRYSIGKKVLMMDILAESAKSLAQIEKPAKEKEQSKAADVEQMKRFKLIDESDDTYKCLNEAKRIVAERIKKKTRRFAQPYKSLLANAKVNRFVDVAGSFFFPLLYGFGKDELTLYGREPALKYDTDNILLLCLLRTITTITLAAQNCPIITKMTPEVLQLGSVLRFHSESRVRLAVLQMLAAAMLATPKSLLQLHFSNYLLEIRAWLEEYLSLNIVKGEKNAECREMAGHVMAICLDALTADTT